MMNNLFLTLGFFAIYLGTVTAGNETTSNQIDQLKADLMKLDPVCAAKFLSNETQTKIEKCFSPHPDSGTVMTNATFCCTFWAGENCVRNIIWNINECKSLRFGNDLSIEAILQQGKLCNPATYSCPSVPHIKPVVKEILETIFLPMYDAMTMYPECTASIGPKMSTCMKPFDPLLYKHSFGHPDSVLCGSELSFYQCFKEVVSKEKKCEVAKEDLEGALEEIKENITKQGCPMK